jgi:hypothetical protein
MKPSALPTPDEVAEPSVSYFDGIGKTIDNCRAAITQAQVGTVNTWLT